MVTDFHAGRRPLVGHVLRIAADHHERVDRVVLADRRHTENADVAKKPSAATDSDVRSDHAIGTDFDIVGDLGSWIDTRCVRDESGHDRRYL